MEDNSIIFAIEEDGTFKKYEEPYASIECKTEEDFNKFTHIVDSYNRMKKPIPIDEWSEDVGNVLWWSFPISDPPYCGMPSDENFPNNVTHYTEILLPSEPKK